MKKEIYFNNISIYNSIVDRSYREYLNYKAQIRKLNPKSYSFLNDSYKLENLMYENAIIIIVFSQMTIEAFCNSFLVKHTNIKKKNLEKMQFKAKINEVIRRVFKLNGLTCKNINYSDYYGENLSVLIKVRNKIVHRYPVCCSLNLDSLEDFKMDSIKAAKEIKKESLRRIDENIIKQSANSYITFIKKLQSLGNALQENDIH